LYDDFSGKLRHVVVLAHDEACRHASDYVGTAHLLLGLTAESTEAVTAALESHGVGADVIGGHVEAMIGSSRDPRVLHLPYST